MTNKRARNMDVQTSDGILPGSKAGKSMLRAITSALFIFAVTSPAFAQDAAAGSEIYKEKCADCHGPRMAPTGAGADLRELKAGEREKFDKIIKEGKNQMPSWDGQLTPEEVDQLWAYQRTRAND